MNGSKNWQEYSQLFQSYWKFLLIMVRDGKHGRRVIMVRDGKHGRRVNGRYFLRKDFVEFINKLYHYVLGELPSLGLSNNCLIASKIKRSLNIFILPKTKFNSSKKQVILKCKPVSSKFANFKSASCKLNILGARNPAFCKLWVVTQPVCDFWSSCKTQR